MHRQCITEFAELMKPAKSGAIRPIPSTGFPLDDAESVLDMLEAGGIAGRAILA